MRDERGDSAITEAEGKTILVTVSKLGSGGWDLGSNPLIGPASSKPTFLGFHLGCWLYQANGIQAAMDRLPRVGQCGPLSQQLRCPVPTHRHGIDLQGKSIGLYIWLEVTDRLRFLDGARQSREPHAHGLDDRVTYWPGAAVELE